MMKNKLTDHIKSVLQNQELDIQHDQMLEEIFDQLPEKKRNRIVLPLLLLGIVSVVLVIGMNSLIDRSLENEPIAVELSESKRFRENPEQGERSEQIMEKEEPEGDKNPVFSELFVDAPKNVVVKGSKYLQNEKSSEILSTDHVEKVSVLKSTLIESDQELNSVYGHANGLVLGSAKEGQRGEGRRGHTEGQEMKLKVTSGSTYDESNSNRSSDFPALQKLYLDDDSKNVVIVQKDLLLRLSTQSISLTKLPLKFLKTDLPSKKIPSFSEKIIELQDIHHSKFEVSLSSMIWQNKTDLPSQRTSLSAGTQALIKYDIGKFKFITGLNYMLENSTLDHTIIEETKFENILQAIDLCPQGPEDCLNYSLLRKSTRHVFYNRLVVIGIPIGIEYSSGTNWPVWWRTGVIIPLTNSVKYEFIDAVNEIVNVSESEDLNINSSVKYFLGAGIGKSFGRAKIGLGVRYQNSIHSRSIQPINISLPSRSLSGIIELSFRL